MIFVQLGKTFGHWFFRNKNKEQFDQAEINRKELINSKKLGTDKCHPEAIFTSRLLNPFICIVSSNNSMSAVSFYNNQGMW